MFDYNFNSFEVNLFNSQYNTDYTDSDINKILINQLTDCQLNTDEEAFKFCLNFYNISEADWNNTELTIEKRFDLIYNLFFSLTDYFNINTDEYFEE